MTALERAIVEIVGVLEALDIDYMLIGGIANAVWGEPRATVDVDVTIAVDEPSIPATIERLAEHVRVAVADPVSFVGQTRVLPVDTRSGVRADVIFALLPFEMNALRRARSVRLAGRDVRVVTPEDLIVMKIISERPQDLADAEGLTRRRVHELDLVYLDPLVREMATSLERPDILDRWRRWTDA
jgi:predicted nucleotidyltransferase